MQRYTVQLFSSLMRLKSLEINGFKSFPSRTSIQFDAPIAAIVGPNGSGKSNIAEAFRFVLGEQSMKSMRGKRGDDMIFNGSATHSRSNRAHVRMTLNNTDRLFNLDFDEVVIERVVHRDNQNEYFINGSPVRLKDVRELIAGAHIGSSGHHIISQGEADKIVDAAPEERKTMIEDALGLRVYQNRRRESENKLNRTYANIEETKNLRREIAPRLGHLKRQKEKIEAVRQMKTDIRDRYREYFAREAQIIAAFEQDVAEHKEPLQRKKQELEHALQEARTTLERSQASSGEQDQGSTRLREIDEQLSQIDAERSQLTHAIGQLDGQISSQKRIIERAENADAENQHKKVYLAHVEDTYAYVRQQIESASQASTFEAMRSALSAIQESLENFIAANKAERDDAAVKDARSEIARLEDEKTQQNARYQDLERQRQTLTDEYHHITNSKQKQESEGREAERRLYQVRAELTDVTNKLEKQEARETQIERRRQDFENDLSQAGTLVGHAALDYKQYQPVDGDGNAVSREAIINEDAEKQRSRRKEIERLALRIEDNHVDGADEVLSEYNELAERDEFLARELEDLEASAESLRNLIAELDETLEREFREGLKQINERFGTLFAHMFGSGGTAKLRTTTTEKTDDDEVSDEEQEGQALTEGVELVVNPPKKKIRGLQMLSGGERSLVSIALLFAMSQINPPPFIILDETDAALDEANAKKYGDLVEHLAEQSQLVLITHNRETMSRAGVLYGVTMGTTGASTILSVAFEKAAETVASS